MVGPDSRSRMNQPGSAAGQQKVSPVRQQSSCIPQTGIELISGGIGTRTCLGCGVKSHKAELVRFGVTSGVLVADRRQVLPGRGVYCCRNVQCYQRLVKQRKKLAWALRYQETDKVGALVISPGLAEEFSSYLL